MIEPLFDNTMRLLQSGMDARMARQGVLASNIANAETPGYRALDLNFEEVLRRTAERMESQRTRTDRFEGGLGPLDPIRLRLIEADTVSIGNENNTVELERELGKLSENQLLFGTMARMLSKKLALLKEAIGRSS